MRLSATPTVVSNTLMGYWIAHDGWLPAGPLILLVCSSACIYSAGMVLNDVADVEQDRVERPQRPIPSGQISLGSAVTGGWILLLCGILSAVAASWLAIRSTGHGDLSRTLLTVFALVVAVVAYDFRLKQTLWGPVNMGLCRSINIALAMSTSAAVGGMLGFTWMGLGVAAAVGLYVTGITVIARKETGGAESSSNLHRTVGDGFRAMRTVVHDRRLVAAVGAIVGGLIPPIDYMDAAGIGRRGVPANRCRMGAPDTSAASSRCPNGSVFIACD